MGPLAAAVLASLPASVLLSLPAHAEERDLGGGTVSVTVEIDSLECTAACGGGGASPGAELPATGLAPIEPLLWIAMAMVVAGALFALRAQAARHSRVRSRSAAPTAYAVVSGDCAPAAEEPSAGDRVLRREIERGDRA